MKRALAILLATGLAFGLSAEGCDYTCPNGGQPVKRSTGKTTICRCVPPGQTAPSRKWPWESGPHFSDLPKCERGSAS